MTRYLDGRVPSGGYRLRSGRRRWRPLPGGPPRHFDYIVTLRDMTADTTPSLYDWAGGSAAFRALIDAFYDRVDGDDLLGPLFPGGVSEEHRANVALWWGEVFGGPADYTERLGGYERMLAHHRNLGITSEQRFRSRH